MWTLDMNETHPIVPIAWSVLFELTFILTAVRIDHQFISTTAMMGKKENNNNNNNNTYIGGYK